MSTFVPVMKDLKDIEIKRLQAEVVKLSNELARHKNYVQFLQEENGKIEEEVRQECKDEYELKLSSAILERDKALERADKAESLLKASEQAKAELEARVKNLEGAQQVAEVASRANVDYRSIINLIQKRTFNHNSDATRFLNGEIDPHDPRVEDLGIDGIYNRLLDKTAAGVKDTEGKKATRAKKVSLPQKKADEKPDSGMFSSRKRVWTTTELEKVGIDTTGMPENLKIVKRKDKEDGLDTWYVKIISYDRPQVRITEYKIARVYIPGQGMDNTVGPKTIIEGNPVMPSFARFMLESKFGLNLSENRILQILKSLKVKIPQSTLNNWMHQIIELLRLRLEKLMIAAIRQSKFTMNDETRILVRSRLSKDEPFKYNMEYIQAALSLEQNLVVMLYKDGSRDHSIQEEILFRDSEIKYFLADRASIYTAIEKDLCEFFLVRASCWFHARHYLVDAYVSDPRVYDIIEYINFLFYVERESMKRMHTHGQRYRFRLKYSRKIVGRIMKRLEEIRLAGNEYGELVHRAVNYILDDKAAFERFLQDGRIELSNNAIERCFRHIAMGRRNWLHTGSHFAAENIAFIYSLVESCKLNKIEFGEYIEDILTRFMNGEDADESFLPNHYTPRLVCEQKKA